jgi:hypothetical protein
MAISIASTYFVYGMVDDDFLASAASVEARLTV